MMQNQWVFPLFLVNDARLHLRSFPKLVLRVSSKTINALGLQSRALITFLVSGNHDETLALICELLH